MLLERIRRIGPSLGGVFSYGDLSNLIGGGSELQNKRVMKRLVRAGVLFKVRRGLYATPEADLWVLGGRMEKGAYVSLDSVLARGLMVGSVPERSVSLVSTRPGRRTFETPLGIVRFFSIQPGLVFGAERRPDGVAVADREKAYLDLLYYYTKGARFVFDPLSEVDRSGLDRGRLKRYLKKYKNPKFIRFVKNQLQDLYKRKMPKPTRKILSHSKRKIQEVAVSFDGRRLLFLFENGKGHSIPRERLPGDDRTPITHVQIFDHRGAVAIAQASGHQYNLPWDSIKYYAAGGKPKSKLPTNRFITFSQ